MKPAIRLLFPAALLISAAGTGQPTSVSQPDVLQTSDTSNQYPAPVSLVNFTSYKSANKEITINWTTEKEVNNDFFKLERSVNGVDFSTVALIRGKNKNSTYTVTDSQPLVNYSFTNYIYYRLSQTGTDGKIRYFDVLKLLLRGVPGVLIISPNPVKDKLQIQLNTSETGPVTFSIISHSGMLVKQWVMVKQDETLQETISVSDLGEGKFFLQARIRLMVETQQFVKH